MIVVSDASPIIGLSVIRRLDLLRSLYGTLIIPGAVAREIIEDGEGEPGAEQVRESDWIEIREISRTDIADRLGRRLDRGEAEAIALAVEIHAELLLMDERLGRQAARENGLRVVGLLGVLIEAKNHGDIEAVGQLLDRLQIETGFRVSEELRAHVLRTAGELDP